MDYQTARDIRGRTLSSMITTKILAGRGVGSSIGSALSEKMRARATGVKEKFDPMNIARFMTGGSKLSAAVVGKLTGRSQRDIEYFAGTRKRKYSRIEKPSMKISSSSMDVLENMFEFFKKMDERDTKRREIERAFREEKEIEDEKRHKDFISVLRNFLEVPATGAIPTKEEEKGDGLFSKIAAIFGSLFGTFKTLVSSISNLIKGIMKPLLSGLTTLLRLLFRGIGYIAKSLFGLLLRSLAWMTTALVPFLKRLLPILGKLAMRLGIPIAIIGALMAEKNFKDRLTPDEALVILNDPQLLQWAKQFHGIEAKDLEAIINRPQMSKELLQRMDEGPLTRSDAEQMERLGGFQQVKTYAETNLKPVEDGIERFAPFFGGGKTPITREQFVGTGNKAKLKEQVWKLNYEPIYNDQGIRRDLADFVGPYDVLSSTGMSQDDMQRIIDQTMSPYETQGAPPPSTVSEPITEGQMIRSPEELLAPLDNFIGSIVDQQSKSLNDSRRTPYQGTATPNIINSSNPVPLNDAPDPEAADARNRERIFNNASRRLQSAH